MGCVTINVCGLRHDKRVWVTARYACVGYGTIRVCLLRHDNRVWVASRYACVVWVVSCMLQIYSYYSIIVMYHKEYAF